ncbi:MAG: TdeIII family type II restriction endonuclease [Ignavibacteriaceae bacterium]|nr:TdeIII family type II restriction endonuclease [Ignavibacteriaceae bacterium]
MYPKRLKRIQEVLNKLEHKEKGEIRQRPNWENEISYILGGKGELIPSTVICDVYAKNLKTGSAYAFELKAPLPNSDQTKVSKEKIFKLLSMENPQVENAFFALPYNPYGKKEDYNWSFPKRWFDMINDPVVLIGDEFWDFLGGSGTYKLFIDEVNKLGKEYRDRIYREYLGIEPPTKDDFKLK